MTWKEVLPFIKSDFSFSEKQFVAIRALQDSGATVPFMARYRKEQTGGLDELAIQALLDGITTAQSFYQRQEYILETIEEQGQLTPSLRQKIIECKDLLTLEDLYLPFKKRKKTKADTAKELGLEPLAKIIMAQRERNLDEVARRYVKNQVKNTDEAIQGAQYIIADWINQDVFLRERLRDQFLEHAVLSSSVKRGKKEVGQKFKDYFQFNEKIKKCPSYRLLAILRGEQEGILNVKILPDEERALQKVIGRRIKSQGRWAEVIVEACEDAYDRLLAPSLETQTKAFYKEKADEKAIEIFASNLEQLLLAPPLGEKSILAIDPGFRTGCKVVALNPNGDLLEHTVIYPHPPQKQHYEALKTITHLCKKFHIEAIAIGDATAGRETWEWLGQHKNELPECYLVSESGASIYSASAVAREEFPDHDVTVRGAVSIGRRLSDPLAELIKIDPKSIGVGEYQHDVHQPMLRKKLEEVVTSCVNRVGIQLNTASPTLLEYVSGIGKTTAQNIVQRRKVEGPFQNLKELLKVPRLGEKAFQQASGFLRIRDGASPLDNTGIHPESYHIVQKMARTVGVDVEELIGQQDLVNGLQPSSFTDEKFGLATIKDIMEELKKPGLDIRGEMEAISFDQNIRSMEDLKEGMIVRGTINNITGFGAFVDIGIKESGLIHVSELSNTFVQHPSEVVHLQQKVEALVIGLDFPRKRIQLSIKQLN